ncbi:MAG: hypothetical protein CMJ46_00850 [Planctomyces sp.]|nr:hypothetical protein [Planctomyces sp.]
MTAPSKPIRTNIIIPAFFILLMAWLFTAVSSALVVVTNFFLLGFLGILLGVFLTKASTVVQHYIGANYKVCLLLVIITWLVLFVLIFALTGNMIEDRIHKAIDQFDRSAVEISVWLNENPNIKSFIEQLPLAGDLMEHTSAIDSTGDGGAPQEANTQANSAATEGDSSQNGSASNDSGNGASTANAMQLLQSSTVSRTINVINSVLQTALSAILNIAIVIVVGIFLAVDPEMYRDGVVRLCKPSWRTRARDILDQLGIQMWAWSIGRITTMVITGTGVWISLYLIGAPIPFVLGLMAGILTFIPNIGSAIALIMAMVVSLPEGFTTVGLVFATFIGFQLIESYLITPLVQQRAVSIPPALLLTWQVLLGMVAGFLGLAIATPMLAALMVVIRTLWLEEMLGEEESHPTAPGTP